ncbi:MAG: hypothetical protein M3Y03_03315, partial [Verrucomicrobiota bacterium]|nr:hypothetical protein [Verrucomicrobiota bacterium]
MQKIRGAHVCDVLVSAFCGDELSEVTCREIVTVIILQAGRKKFVVAECDDQHAASVRSPE